MTGRLSSLTLGAATLSPTFDPAVTEYTATFDDPDGEVSAVADSSDTTITMTFERSSDGAATIGFGSITKFMYWNTREASEESGEEYKPNDVDIYLGDPGHPVAHYHVTVVEAAAEG